MQSTTPIPKTATARTGRPHPLLIEDAVRATAAAALTPEQSAFVLDDGLGAWRTAPVETDLRDIDDGHPAYENAQVPFLSAEVVVSDYRSQAYGRRTQVWLSYGTSTGSITPVKAREVLEAMRAFLPQLEAVAALAEGSAAGDFEGDPEVYAAEREAEDRRVLAITEARVAAVTADLDVRLEAVAAEYADCPRCRNKMDLPGASRATPDRGIEICGPCCSDEAAREAAGLPWPAVAEWPVTGSARA